MQSQLNELINANPSSGPAGPKGTPGRDGQDGMDNVRPLAWKTEEIGYFTPDQAATAHVRNVRGSTYCFEHSLILA